MKKKYQQFGIVTGQSLKEKKLQFAPNFGTLTHVYKFEAVLNVILLTLVTITR